MIKLWAALLIVLAAAAVIAGCGSSDDDSSTTASLTKAEFSKEANAICERGRQKALASTATTEAAVIEESTLPAIESSIEEVRALQVPQEVETQIKVLLDSMEAAADEVESKSVSTLGELEATFEKSGNLARESGLSRCAYG